MSEALRRGGEKAIMSTSLVNQGVGGPTAKKAQTSLNPTCAPNMLVFLCLR